jgi:hypothetical protein
MKRDGPSVGLPQTVLSPLLYVGPSGGGSLCRSRLHSRERKLKGWFLGAALFLRASRPPLRVRSRFSLWR